MANDSRQDPLQDLVRELGRLPGVGPKTAARLAHHLLKVSTAEEGWRMVPDEKGKSAQTRWRKLAEREGQSLMEFSPLSGRTHQIRVHAARGLGAAIVGDPVYGARNGSMLLHSWRIVVPRDKKPPIDVTAPVPDSFGLWLDFLHAA